MFITDDESFDWENPFLRSRVCKSIYQKLLAQYAIQANQCVFIDDLQVNLDVAKSLGFETILATSEQQNIIAIEELLKKKGYFHRKK